jgi:hypothetical protein
MGFFRDPLGGRSFNAAGVILRGEWIMPRRPGRLKKSGRSFDKKKDGEYL